MEKSKQGDSLFLGKFPKVNYNKLNSRQKETYNFQKISGLLADFGFVTILLNDDWNGADFLALGLHGETFRVQLKGRLTFDKKYLGKDLWICFRGNNKWFFFPHDKLLDCVKNDNNFAQTDSWVNKDAYSWPVLSKNLLAHLDPYCIS